MEKVTRRHLVDEVEKTLLREIRSGAWSKTLPATRVLAESLGVSAPTLSVALKRLQAKGVIYSRGQRRAFGISEETSGEGASRSSQRKRVLLVTHAELDQLDAPTREVLRTFLEMIAGMNWGYETHVIEWKNAKHPHKSWSAGVEEGRFQMAVLVGGRPVAAEWLRSLNMPFVCFGGSLEAASVAQTGVGLAEIYESALDRLIRLGHTRIFSPLCDVPENKVKRVRESFARKFEKAGILYLENQHTPWTEYHSREVLWNMMARALETVKPTAVILEDWKDFVPVSCLFKQLGLEIPRDISVMVVNNSLYADWHFPRIACYQTPVRRLAKQLARWVELEGHVEPGLHSHHGTWRDAESVAAVPAKGSEK